MLRWVYTTRPTRKVNTEQLCNLCKKGGGVGGGGRGHCSLSTSTNPPGTTRGAKRNESFHSQRQFQRESSGNISTEMKSGLTKNDWRRASADGSAPAAGLRPAGGQQGHDAAPRGTGRHEENQNQGGGCGVRGRLREVFFVLGFSAVPLFSGTVLIRNSSAVLLLRML